MATDFTTPLGQVRALIPDLDDNDRILPDAVIEAYLALSGDKVFSATAMALDAIATDETLTYKITATDDLKINGVSGAEQLRLRAKDLRTQQEQADADQEGSFQLVYGIAQNSWVRPPEATAWPVY